MLVEGRMRGIFEGGVNNGLGDMVLVQRELINHSRGSELNPTSTGLSFASHLSWRWLGRVEFQGLGNHGVSRTGNVL
jgi:hypothetical protein